MNFKIFLKVNKSQVVLAVFILLKLIESLPQDKISDRSKLGAFADDKIDATEKLKFVLGRVENIMGKGENACYQHFLLFPQCFQKTLSQDRESGLCGKGLIALYEDCHLHNDF